MKPENAQTMVRNVNYDADLQAHITPHSASDKVAFAFTKFLRFFADTFFSKRYGHRAVVLETVAAVPGMVGGLLLHLTALRKMRADEAEHRDVNHEFAHAELRLLKPRPARTSTFGPWQAAERD